MVDGKLSYGKRIMLAFVAAAHDTYRITNG
jgi:hypothetical protein